MMLNPEERRDRATRIRLVCFDVDGSLTDGRLWFGAHGEETLAEAELRKSGQPGVVA